ncbi:MAG: DUF5667 domain-containing protein [Actinomycetota bacterium]|nr:DUF5667 domain-containing protein [Actinomycetota bacterium]
MKKGETGERLMVSFLGAVLALTLSGSVAMASTENTIKASRTLLQGDPFYWVKCEQEQLGLCIYAGTDAEAGFRLNIAQERLDEANRLMEQSRFAEANSALEQYRVQIQAISQAMVSIKQRAASATGTGSSPGDGSLKRKVAVRIGWMSPGEISARFEHRIRTQLQTLDRLCAQCHDQVREQARLALEECARACTRYQSGQAAGQGVQVSGSGQFNKPQDTSVTSGQQSQARKRTQTQEQKQIRDQDHEQEPEQNQEQNRNKEQEQEQNRPANQQQQSRQNQNAPR